MSMAQSIDFPTSHTALLNALEGQAGNALAYGEDKRIPCFQDLGEPSVPLEAQLHEAHPLF